MSACNWCGQPMVACHCAPMDRGVMVYGAPRPPNFPSYPNAFPKPAPAWNELEQKRNIDALTAQNAHFANQVSELADALAHERDRARRVVRVFWRVRWDEGEVAGVHGRKLLDCFYRFDMKEAKRRYREYGPKVYRVTVRRKAKP